MMAGGERERESRGDLQLPPAPSSLAPLPL
jgi:hypothetical protein